jgi:hypothetical protein
MAEDRKLIYWADTLPSTSETWRILKSKLPRGLFSEIRKVRNYGVHPNRRIEIFCSSLSSRDRLFDHCCANPLGRKGEHFRKGKNSCDRARASLTSAPVGSRRKSSMLSLPPSMNSFAPLAATEPKERFSFKVGFLNTNGISPLFLSLWESAKVTPTVLAVVETYRGEAAAKLRPPGYHFLEKPLRSGTCRGRRVDEDSHGVGFFVKSEWAQVIQILEHPVKFADCLWIRMRRGYEFDKPTAFKRAQLPVHCRVEKELWVGVYYLAPRLSEKSLLDCIEELDSIVKRAGDSGAECLVLGDFNCCLRLPEDPLRALTHGANLSSREEMIISLMKRHGLRSLHEKHSGCLFTFSREGFGRTMPDYLLVSESSFGSWRKPIVHSDADLDSDHWMLSSKLKGSVEVLKASELVAGPPRTHSNRRAAHPGWKIRRLSVSSHTEGQPSPIELKDSIKNRLISLGLLRRSIPEQVDNAQEGVIPTIPVSFEAWSEAVSQTLDEVLGKNALRRRRKLPSFFTDELWTALVERRVAYAALRASCTNANSSAGTASERWIVFLQCKAKCRDVAKVARTQHWQRFMDEVNSSPKGSRDMFRLLQRSKGVTMSSRWDVIKDANGQLVNPSSPHYLERWEQFYRELGNPGVKEPSPLKESVLRTVSSDQFLADPVPQSAALSSLNGPLSLDEVTEALDSLPNFKAIGADGLSNEALKALGPEVIFGAFSMLWEKEESPESWALAMIHPLKKAGDPTDLGNSRGISLVSCLCKLFESVLNRRLATFLSGEKKISPEQGGFRAHHECIEHAVILSEVLRRRVAEKKSTFVGFIDFAKAFDTVWRDALFLKLSRSGVQGRMLRMIRALYRRTEATVRVNGQFTNIFETFLGVRQGGVLSPLLFLVYIDDLVAALRAKGIGVFVPGVQGDDPFSPRPKLPGLLWADDVVILADTQEMLREAFAVVDLWCRQWLMSVNAKKSNVMLVGPHPPSALRALERIAAAEPFTLGGGVVSPTKVYKYLGIQFRYDLSWGDAVDARCTAVRHAIFAQGAILRNLDISCEIRRRFFESVIAPVSLWGSELWAHDERKCKQVEKALGPALRMLLNVPARANRTALQWELGLVPLRVEVALRRLRLLQKWKRIAHTGLWARRIHLSSVVFSNKTLSWHRATVDLAKKVLKVIDENLSRPTILTSINGRDLSSEAALRHYRKKLTAKKSVVMCDFVALHEYEIELSPAPHLLVRSLDKMARTETMLRTGALLLNDRVSKFAPERPAICQSCASGKVETYVHFLWECQGLEQERALWVSLWQLIQIPRELRTVAAALREGPHFQELSHEEVLNLRVVRLRALHSMWRKRCALLALRSNHVVVPNPLGVEASV